MNTFSAWFGYNFTGGNKFHYTTTPMVGEGYRWFGLTGYLYNLGFDDPYAIITLSVSFPE